MTIHLRSIRTKRVAIGNFTRLSGPMSPNMTGRTAKIAITLGKNPSGLARAPSFISRHSIFLRKRELLCAVSAL